MIWDVGAILAGVGSIIGAVAAILARKSAKAAERQLTTNNSGSTAKDASDRQEAALAAILANQDAQGELLRSTGRQIGEIRADLGRMDNRVTGLEGDFRGHLEDQAADSTARRSDSSGTST